jgi:NAD+ dependent glucose-6-phosphate dehydrogenase
MSKNVIITGAGGTIGQVAVDQLQPHHQLTLLGLSPELEEMENGHRIDLAEERNRLQDLFHQQDAVVHLAWNMDENYNTDRARIEKRTMFENVYVAAGNTGVETVVAASSIHAIYLDPIFAEQPHRSIARGSSDRDELSESQWIGFEDRQPASLYGWCKRLMEYRGQKHAEDDLFVTCVRFGGVNPDDNPDYPGAHEPVNYYPSVYLSHNDCGRLLRHIIDLDPDNYRFNYELLYGISDNRRRVHTYQNRIGWQPVDDSEEALRDYWDPYEPDG